MNTRFASQLSAMCLAVAGSVTMTAAHAAPVTYDFGLVVASTTVTGFFTIDGSSPRYVGGGTTTRADLLDYSFTFTKGATTFVGTPQNSSGIQTFRIRYAPDLLTVTAYDVSLSFRGAVPGAFFLPLLETATQAALFKSPIC